MVWGQPIPILTWDLLHTLKEPVIFDNISVDNIRQSSSSASPIANGQSDHDVIHLTVNITAVITILWGWSTSKTNYETIMQFQLLLKNSTLKYLCKAEISTVKVPHFWMLPFLCVQPVLQLNTSTKVLLLKLI